MKKSILLATLVLAIGVGFASAQDAETQEEPQPDEEVPEEVSTGWFTPDSALYGLETAWDNTGMALGVKSPGDVAQKRAAEAQVMAEEGNYGAAQRAAEGLENAASRAGDDDIEGIEQATSTLERVIEDAPEEALEGLQTAMENVAEAGPEDLEIEPGPPGDEPGEDVEPGQPDDEPQPGDQPNGDAEAGGEETREIVVENDGMSFETGEIEVEEGEEVTITFANQGGIHDLRIPELEVGTEEISGGERASFTHTFDEPGTYEFECSVGNHAEQGMTGDIVVE